MTSGVLATPATETVSPALWRIWFDRGLKAIDDGEFSVAIQWLREALRHVCAGGPDDRKHAMTQGQLAFAYLRTAFETCRRAIGHSVDPCGRPLDDCEEKKLEAFAKQAMEQARIEAEAAAGRLSYIDGVNPDLQNNLATARLFHVRGEVRRLADDFLGARENFLYSRRGYFVIPSQVRFLDEVDVRLFESNYQLGDFRNALFNLVDVEKLVGEGNDAKRLAQLTAARADTLVQLGRYREADLLFDRWRNLLGLDSVFSQAETTYEFAFALATFGRTKLIQGYYPEAARLIDHSRSVISRLPFRKDWLRECLTCRYSCCPCRDDSLRFDVELLSAELPLEVGDYVSARDRLSHVAKLNPSWVDRRIRLSLAEGKLALALGCFPDACRHFTRARQLSEAMSPCRSVFFIPALLGQSRSESETSSWVAAIALANQAIQCLEQRLEMITAEMVWSLHELAVAYVRDDRGREAEPLCEKALSLLTMTLRPGHPDEGAIRLTMAESQIANRQPLKAIESSSQAISLFQKYSPIDGFAQARALRIVGEAYQSNHEPSCAMHYFLCAFECWKEQDDRLGCVHPEKSLIWLDLAVANVSKGERIFAENLYPVLRPLLCLFKGNPARAGFELNRRGNLLQANRLYEEADWLYCHAEELYCECYGSDHAFTHQVRANRLTVARRKSECPSLMLDCQ